MEIFGTDKTMREKIEKAEKWEKNPKEDKGHLIKSTDEFVNVLIPDAFIFCPTLRPFQHNEI